MRKTAGLVTLVGIIFLAGGAACPSTEMFEPASGASPTGEPGNTQEATPSNGSPTPADETVEGPPANNLCTNTTESAAGDCNPGDIDRQFLCRRDARSRPQGVCLTQTTKIDLGSSLPETPLARVLGLCNRAALAAAETTTVERLKVDGDGRIVEAFRQTDDGLEPTDALTGRFVVAGGCLILVSELADTLDPVEINLEDLDLEDFVVPEADAQSEPAEPQDICADFELSRTETGPFGINLPLGPGVADLPLDDDGRSICIDVLCVTTQECLEESGRWITRFSTETTFTALDGLENVPVSLVCDENFSLNDRETVSIQAGDSVTQRTVYEVVHEVVPCQ